MHVARVFVPEQVPKVEMAVAAAGAVYFTQ